MIPTLGHGARGGGRRGRSRGLLLAGLAVGEGGIGPLDISADSVGSSPRSARSLRDVLGALAAALLAVFAVAGKMWTGWIAAGREGADRAGRLRAGSALVARGEFSIVIASLGATLVDGEDLGAVAAAFVLLTAIAGPVATRYVRAPSESSTPTTSPTTLR